MHQSKLKCWPKPVYSGSSQCFALPVPVLSIYYFMHSGPTSTASNSAQPQDAVWTSEQLSNTLASQAAWLRYMYSLWLPCSPAGGCSSGPQWQLAWQHTLKWLPSLLFLVWFPHYPSDVSRNLLLNQLLALKSLHQLLLLEEPELRQTPTAVCFIHICSLPLLSSFNCPPNRFILKLNARLERLLHPNNAFDTWYIQDLTGILWF